jgi:hypothetical protein
MAENIDMPRLVNIFAHERIPKAMLFSHWLPGSGESDESLTSWMSQIWALGLK